MDDHRPYAAHFTADSAENLIQFELPRVSRNGKLFIPTHGISVPCYTTICRRRRHLLKYLSKLSRRRPKICIMDSSGFKISGEGEWKTKIHGKSYHRSWSKVHLLVDSDSNEIVNLIVTSPEVGDISAGLKFLKNLPPSTKTVLADGAYDGGRFRYLAYSKGVKAIIPPPRTGKFRESEWFNERNDALAIINSLGNNQSARSLWGRLTGYCHRVKGESAFSRLKRLFSESLYSRNTGAQLVELWLKALLSNIWLSWAS